MRLTWAHTSFLCCGIIKFDSKIGGIPGHSNEEFTKAVVVNLFLATFLVLIYEKA